MCWNPCLRISDVEVKLGVYRDKEKKPGPKGGINPTVKEIEIKIARSIPESGCEKGCPCQTDPDEPKKLHQRQGRHFEVTIEEDGKGSVTLEGKCDIKYSTQAGICEPESLGIL